jgi:hypothetical protein
MEGGSLHPRSFKFILTDNQLKFGKNLLETASRDGDSEELHPILHRFLFGMLAESDPSVLSDNFNCTMERVIILLQLKSDLTFRDPNTISHSISGLQWGARAIFLTEAIRRGDETFTYTDNTSFPNPDYVTPTAKVVEETVEKPMCSPYKTIQYWLRETHEIARNAHGEARVTWTNEEQEETMLYNDTLISIERMGDMFRDLMTDVEQLISRNLFYNKKFLFELPTIVHDNIADHQLEYSWMTDARNAPWTSHYGENFFYRQYILTLPSKERHFETQITPTLAARKWLIDLEDFKVLTGILLKLTGGGCPRDSEMLSLQLETSSTGHRAFYFIGREMIMLQEYDKMSYTRSEPAPIPHVVFPRLARAMAIYLLVLRPYELLLNYTLFGAENMRELKYLYFVNGKGRLPQEVLSNRIGQIMTHYFGSRLTSRDLRHILHAITTHTTPPEFNSVGAVNYGIRSFHHTERIGKNIYGRELRGFGILHPEEALQFLCVSHHGLPCPKPSYSYPPGFKTYAQLMGSWSEQQSACLPFPSQFSFFRSC